MKSGTWLADGLFVYEEARNLTLVNRLIYEEAGNQTLDYLFLYEEAGNQTLDYPFIYEEAGNQTSYMYLSPLILWKIMIDSLKMWKYTAFNFNVL